MSTSEQIKQLEKDNDELLTAWMGTAGAQIFIMQLGFLLFETGMVDPMWSASIIIKNLEDTWVGILAYMMFGWTMTSGDGTWGGVLGTMENSFLVGVPDKLHEEVFIAAMFATTTATIMSGCILERMKNKGYIVWCFLIVAVNYSIISHWVWNPRGWLYKMGFIDCAGSSVVHMVGGVGALTSSYFLGPRHGSVDEKTGMLKPSKPSQRPILVAMGTFILWYGWFAFNISSPVAADMDIGGRLGTVGLNTCVAPTAASFSCFLIMYKILDEEISFEHLVSCVLAGLVCITAGAMTVPLWAGYLQGFLVSFVYFGMVYVEREWMMVDDPLAVGPVHLWGGCTGIILEGVFADDKLFDKGLVFGGFKHFGVQLLGCIVILCFAAFSSVCLWYLMDKVIFMYTDLRVSPLDTYLGTRLFNVNSKLAFQTLVECKTVSARKLLYDFHQFTLLYFCEEQLDFLVAIHSFRQMYDELLYDSKPLYVTLAPQAKGQSSDDSTQGVKKDALKVNVGMSNSPNTSPRLLTPTGEHRRNQSRRDVMKSPSMGMGFDQNEEEEQKMGQRNRETIGKTLTPALDTSVQHSEQEKIIDECIKQIMDLYLNQDSIKCVNVSDVSRSQCRRARENHERTRRLINDIEFFDRCYDEVMKMLSPIFFRFLTIHEDKIKEDRTQGGFSFKGMLGGSSSSPASPVSGSSSAGATHPSDNSSIVGSMFSWFKGGSPKNKNNGGPNSNDVEMGNRNGRSLSVGPAISDEMQASWAKKFRGARIPYRVDRQWNVIWDEELLKKSKKGKSWRKALSRRGDDLDGEEGPEVSASGTDSRSSVDVSSDAGSRTMSNSQDHAVAKDVDEMNVIFLNGHIHGYYASKAILARVLQANSGNPSSDAPKSGMDDKQASQAPKNTAMTSEVESPAGSTEEQWSPDVSGFRADIESAPASPEGEAGGTAFPGPLSPQHSGSSVSSQRSLSGSARVL